MLDAEVPKHNISNSGVISPPPRDGQKALDNSVPHPDNPTARVSIEDGKLVELKLTLDQSHIAGGVKTYHGFVHEKPWKKLDESLKGALIRGGLVDKMGNQLF